MRPLSLKVKGFTSFRDEQAIDFTDLDLFVLWGPTGSGKSSLLDAMTYALFGYVERVGNQVSQLVSHGQPRLSVSLDFAVGDVAYRVTRSTTQGGQSKALLERHEGDEWASYGEGADLVREVNKIIPGLIGLDYEAFTRSVVLPQGKFAEFLTGDASKRREILTELLGLELFKRMSQRANEIAKNAKIHLETKSELLEREYAGVDQDGLTKAKEQHDSLVEMVAAAEKIESKVDAIEKRWSAAEASRKALAECVNDVGDAAETFSQAAITLDEHAKTAAGSEAALAAAHEALAQADRTVAEASKKRATAEGKWGSLEDLAALRSRAGTLEDARAEHNDAVEMLGSSQETAAAAQAEAKKAATAAAKAAGEAESAARKLQHAEAAHDATHKKDSVGALVADLKPGDPCPVCDRPLDTIPKAARKEIQAAKKALEAARKAAASLSIAQTEAETAHALALQKVEAAKNEVARCKKVVTNRKGRLDVLGAEIGAVAGKTQDPVAQIDKRAEELRELVAAEAAAKKIADEARAEASRRELAASKLAGEIEKVRTRIAAVPLTPLCRRVGEAAPEVEIPDLLPAELPGPPDRLATVTASAGKELAKLAQELEGLHATRTRELEDLLEEVREALPVPLQGTVGLADIVAQTRAATTQLKSEAALAAKAAKDLGERLETKRRYEQEIESHRHEQSVYSALGKELKSDRIVQYLQAEALIALAQAASAHLDQLSSTRYRLSYEDDRFFVVDAWNGDERRSVKTLSGGETFQASLALALALSEQVQFLAVTERNQLDSLFLDEGFGTLDAETLEVVVSAIEQLGGDGRLVGVITHVPELADRLPVRFEVTKSQRGSQIKRAEHELAVASL